MDKQAISFAMGKRLKDLREERSLSHDNLIKQLNAKYGISVSRDSLMAYEISDESRTKASKFPNMGMRVEYLYCLADFYGVSLDYLLGKTDVRIPDCTVQSMCKYTGLSEYAVETLRYFNAWFGDTYLIRTINLLIEQEELPPNHDVDFCYDIDNPTAQEEEAYKQEWEDWENKGLVPILSIIDNFFSIYRNPESIYDLCVTGELLKGQKRNCLKGLRFESICKILASDVIERVLLSDIEDGLKKLKEKELRNNFQHKST